MYQPLHDYVIIKPIVRQLSTTLWVDNREKWCQGTIVAAGKKATAVKEGEFVIYGGEDYLNFKTLIDDDGQKYQIIQEADICAVVDELPN